MIEKSELFEYLDHAKHKTFVWVRLYRSRGWTTVIATDRSSTHSCRSITNSVEEFASAALDFYGLQRERVIWVEHYDYEPLFTQRRHFWRRNETFDLVRFERFDDGRFHKPEWQRITREIAEQWAGEEIAAISAEVTQ